MAKKETAKEKKLREAKLAAEKAAKEAAEMESETEDEDGKDGDGDTGHDDADQDKELIKKMLDEYVGKSDDMDKAERAKLEGLGMEAYEAHKEMGAKDEEAFKHAGMALKLAKHMAKKHAEADEAAKEAADKDGKDGDTDGKDGKDGACEAEEKELESENESEGHKEATKKVTRLETKLLEAQGKIAALEAKSKKAEISEHVETKLKESGQPNSITKRFREAAGEFKSTKDFDVKWSIFIEGVKNTGSGLAAIDWKALKTNLN